MYGDRSFNRAIDPITIIFRGGEGRITSSRVGRHMTDDWRGWGVRRRNPACKSTKYLPFTSPNGSRASFAAPSMYGTTNPLCGNQHHGRFWNDRRHSELFNHETTGNFIVGGVHKERIASCGLSGGPIPVPYCAFHTHRISGDFDQARRYTYRAMRFSTGRAPSVEREHRVQPKWGVHPTAKKWYQGKHHSRVISRISMRHYP